MEGIDQRIGLSWARHRGMPIHVARVAAELAADLELKAKLLASLADGWDDRGRWDLVVRTLDAAAFVLRNPVRLPDVLRRRLDEDGPGLAAASGIDPARARKMDQAWRLRQRAERRSWPRVRKLARVRRRWK